MKDAYIGNIEVTSSFNYEKGDYNGNVPKRESPFFPFPSDFLFLILDKIKNGAIEGKQVDFGGWVAKLTPPQIIELLDEVAKMNVKYIEYVMREKIKQLDPAIVDTLEEEEIRKMIDPYLIYALKDFIEGLDQEKIYAFTIAEF